MSKPPAVPSRRRTGAVLLAAACATALLAAGLALSDVLGGREDEAEVTRPTANMTFDYQIGGPYAPAKGVAAVSRDRSAEPVEGLYNVCYVNAFQAQPDAQDWWEENHPGLVLHDKDQRAVMDEDWGEALLDTSSEDKRGQLGEIVGDWIDGCAESGFQAVEADNLDSHERSGGRLTRAHNAAFARLLADRAHAAGLAFGQKNTAGMLAGHEKTGFDFAVVEECGQYDECDAFAEAYADRVFVIEYTEEGFDKACSDWGTSLSVVLRDLDVAPRGTEDHVFRTC